MGGIAGVFTSAFSIIAGVLLILYQYGMIKIISLGKMPETYTISPPLEEQLGEGKKNEESQEKPEKQQEEQKPTEDS